MLNNILGAIAFIAPCFLVPFFFKSRSDARSIPRLMKKIKNRIPMSEGSFIANYGRPLTDDEKTLILEMRRALALAAEVERSLLYPHDGMFDFFTDWAAEFDAVPELLIHMEELSLIEKYGVDIEKVKNPDFHGNMPIAEFFDSVIEASRLYDGQQGNHLKAGK